jgi:hypothetical protein
MESCAAPSAPCYKHICRRPPLSVSETLAVLGCNYDRYMYAVNSCDGLIKIGEILCKPGGYNPRHVDVVGQSLDNSVNANSAIAMYSRKSRLELDLLIPARCTPPEPVQQSCQILSAILRLGRYKGLTQVVQRVICIRKWSLNRNALRLA